MSMDQGFADDEDLKVIVNRMSAREVNKDVVKNWEEEMDGKSKREDTEIKKKIKVSMKHERIGMFSVVRKMVVMCWNMVMRVGKYELWFNLRRHLGMAIKQFLVCCYKVILMETLQVITEKVPFSSWKI